MWGGKLRQGYRLGGGGGGGSQKTFKFRSPETQFREQFFLHYKVHKFASKSPQHATLGGRGEAGRFGRGGREAGKFGGGGGGGGGEASHLPPPPPSRTLLGYK